MDDGKGEPTHLGYFKAIAGLCSALAWPAVIISLYFALRVPIGAILKVFPDEIKQISHAHIGDLAFDLNAVAAKNGDPEIAKTISGLSSNAIKMLLALTNGDWNILSKDNDGSCLIYNTTTLYALQELKEPLINSGGDARRE